MLVPFVDLINHSTEPNTDYEYSEATKQEGFVVHATRDIAQGEQIFVDYGHDKSNESLLRIYGFTDPNHSWSGENLKFKLRLS